MSCETNEYISEALAAAHSTTVKISKRKAESIKTVTRAMMATIKPRRFPLHIRIEKYRDDPVNILGHGSPHGICDPALALVIPDFPVIIAIRNSNDLFWMLNVLTHELGHYEQLCLGRHKPTVNKSWSKSPFEIEATRFGCEQLLLSSLPRVVKTRIVLAGLKIGYHPRIWLEALETLKGM